MDTLGKVAGETASELKVCKWVVAKKRISIKYALPVAERIIQMVEKAYEECDD